MKNKQILSLLSLSKNPLIEFTNISLHEGKRFVGTICSSFEADPEQVENLILSVFPECSLSKNDEYELSEDGLRLYKIKWLLIDDATISVHFYKKAPVITQEPQENTSPDSTTEWTPEQILRSGGIRK